MLETGIVQSLNLLRRQQVAIGDDSGDYAVMANSLDHLLHFRMKQWFTAAERDDCGLQIRKPIDTTDQFVRRHRRGKVIVFITIAAGQVAFSSGDDVRKK